MYLDVPYLFFPRGRESQMTELTMWTSQLTNSDLAPRTVSQKPLKDLVKVHLPWYGPVDMHTVFCCHICGVFFLFSFVRKSVANFTFYTLTHFHTWELPSATIVFQH